MAELPTTLPEALAMIERLVVDNASDLRLGTITALAFIVVIFSLIGLVGMARR